MKGITKKQKEIQKALQILKDSHNFESAFHDMTDYGISQSDARKYIRSYRATLTIGGKS